MASHALTRPHTASHALTCTHMPSLTHPQTHKRAPAVTFGDDHGFDHRKSKDGDGMVSNFLGSVRDVSLLPCPASLRRAPPPRPPRIAPHRLASYRTTSPRPHTCHTSPSHTRSRLPLFLACPRIALARLRRSPRMERPPQDQPRARPLVVALAF